MRTPARPSSLSALLAATLLAAACSHPSAPSRPPDPARQDDPAALAPAPEPEPVPDLEPAQIHKDEAAWSAVEQLVSEQKLEAAAARVRALREAARAAGNEGEWTLALVREVQLRIGLHGYETAVRLLREEPWPENPLWRAALDLYYAHALTSYSHLYSWEIARREKVATEAQVALEAWTKDEIYAEAQRAFERVWRLRAPLGKLPVAQFDAFVVPNDYPREIRGTLRDTVSYLRVELLADTAGWRPEQLNELFRLDAVRLIGGDPTGSSRVRLDDPAVHPLLKIGAILDDLESWHAASGRTEAALEARLERSRRLHASFNSAGDRAAIARDLEARLERAREVPWWSMGMATLAGFAQARNEPDSLVEARRLALAGAERFPQSAGGQRCRHLVALIEAPSFNLSSMATDGPRKRSVLVTHKNLPALWMRAYPFDLEGQLATAKGHRLLPDGEDLRAALAGREPAAAWKAELSPTPDYRDHKSFVTPPLSDRGAYLLVASAREDFAFEANQVVGCPFVVTGLVVLSRTGPDGIEASVVSGETGAPVPAASVTLFRYDWNTGHAPVQTLTTGADGTALFPARKNGHTHFLFAKRGADVTVDPDYLYSRRATPPRDRRASLVYTDRTVYRPLQKVQWKVIAYGGGRDPARYRTLPATEVTVTLLDANHQAVESKKVKTNAFGSAHGEFELPAGRALGAWQISTSPNGWASLRVEEYKRPTFEASIEDPAEPLRLNREAKLTGKARYYFGLPVASGSARWRVVRTPVYRGWWYVPPVQAQTVATGLSKLAEDGSFALAFTPEADARGEDAQGVTYRYEVHADVLDEGGETRSASRAFRLGFVSVEAQVQLDEAFFTAEEPGQVTVLRTDLDGVGRPGQGTWKLFALEGPQRTPTPAEIPLVPRPDQKGFRSPGDALRPRFATDYSAQATMRAWPDGPERAAGQLEHDAEGKAQLALPRLPPGAYRLRYETADEHGAKFATGQELVVAGEKTDLALPALLLAQRSSVPAGGRLRLLAHSGLEDQPMLLEVFQSGRRVSRQRLRSGRSPSLIELPVTEAERGGFVVRLSAVRDWQLVRIEQSVFVPWDDKQLEVGFATFRDRLRPGQGESWRVSVKGPRGAALDARATELLAYMYDRSLDVFAPHVPFDPLQLYPGRARADDLKTSLGQAQSLWAGGRNLFVLPGFVQLSPDRLVDQDPYGIGGPGRRTGGYGGRMRRMAKSASRTESREGLVAEQPAPGDSSASLLGGSVSDKSKDAFAPAPEAAEAPSPAPDALRSDFSETGFWQPQLVLGPDGTASIAFQVPDSVTSWKVWVHAVTRDLKAGSTSREAQSAKELMVRPYLPRFVREGDEASLKVVVNNASDRPLDGTLDFDIVDPASGESLRTRYGVGDAQAKLAFAAPRGGSATLAFPIRVPRGVGEIAFKVTASSGDFSDGELRPLPVLPSRVRLAQSRFATLKDKAHRTLSFEDLARGDDPSLVNESLVVTLDGQLFYSVLSALPYLTRYPYECTEQTLNRFVSTGIVSSLYDRYPAIGRMAKKLAARETRFETFDAVDPNRKLTLEESPWLLEAQGGGKDGVLNVLDPRLARAERISALAKLRKAQTSSGGFPWWPGGPPSPYMTLYLMYGFAKAAEFGVEVPRELVQRGWAYLGEHYRREYQSRLSSTEHGWEFLTFLNYTASCYPDDAWTGGALSGAERKEILEYSFAHWKRHSPYLKAQLALTLARAGRARDARLVFDSVMDSAKTTEDGGTFWAPEDRAWLWYNDTLESHAFALRTLAELDPKDPRRDGLVHWLMLNKKLSHWKSTRATAEVIYSLVHHLQAEGQLGVRERAKVTVGPLTRQFVFEPDEYTGKKNQVVVAGEEIDPETMSAIVVEKDTPGLMFASATWHFSTEKPPKEARGDLLEVSRTYFKRQTSGREATLTPLAEGARLEPGDEIEVQLSLRAKHPAEYVHLRDPRAAGLEPVSSTSRFKWDLGLGYYEEVRDSSTNFFFERLPQGEYTFKYRLRAATAGRFRVGPATVQSMYAPEFVAYSSGATLAIEPAASK